MRPAQSPETSVIRASRSFQSSREGVADAYASPTKSQVRQPLQGVPPARPAARREQVERPQRAAKPQVRHPSRTAPKLPRTPHVASSERCRTKRERPDGCTAAWSVQRASQSRVSSQPSRVGPQRPDLHQKVPTAAGQTVSRRCPGSERHPALERLTPKPAHRTGGVPRERWGASRRSSPAWVRRWERTTFVGGFRKHLAITRVGNVDEK